MSETYEVREGDCVSSLAYDRGLLFETVWNHPNNSSLKTNRTDPNVLKPGDLLYIPDLTQKVLDCSTDARHKFVRKGTPANLTLRFVRDELQQPPDSVPPAAAGEAPRHFTGEDPIVEGLEKDVPRANVPYVLSIDGQVIEGNTDNDGYLKCQIRPNVKEARLTLEPGTLNETVIPLRLGGLDPLKTVSGIKHRLSNLGLNCGDDTDELTDAFAAALRVYQERAGLEVTGEINDATRNKLRNAHGS
ncbi:MAG TPA: peptidoglycan-binding domain-containing protein [Terracidiphilus sp.]|jgi:N-acetylmuramoyl-L-alanine amidase